MSTLTLFEFTQKHLNNNNTEQYITTANDLESKKIVRFTITPAGPICSISQEPFKIGEIIAVCNKCFAAFLARTLSRSFIKSKNKTFCPLGCGAELNKNEIKLSDLEKLRLTIDLIRDKITLLEYQLQQKQKELKKIFQDTEEGIKILDALCDEEDSFEDDEVKEIILGSKTEEKERGEKLTQEKENEIKQVQENIQKLKINLQTSLEKERNIINQKKSKQLIEFYNRCLKTAAIASIVALLFFASLKISQNNIFCSPV